MVFLVLGNKKKVAFKGLARKLYLRPAKLPTCHQSAFCFMKKIELEIVALSHSLAQTQNYAVVLGEQDGVRRLPIVIGGFEAQAIAVAMEGMNPSRPMTHDLFRNTLLQFEIEVKEIIISDLRDGIFYANIVCLKDKEEIEIDSRTSDALAIAVRFNCPIFTYDFILEQAGIVLEEEAEQEVQKAKQRRQGVQPKERGLKDLDEDELEQALEQALEEEDYEKAAKIRDEMNRRKA